MLRGGKYLIGMRIAISFFECLHVRTLTTCYLLTSNLLFHFPVSSSRAFLFSEPSSPLSLFFFFIFYISCRQFIVFLPRMSAFLTNSHFSPSFCIVFVLHLICVYSFVYLLGVSSENARLKEKRGERIRIKLVFALHFIRTCVHFLRLIFP